MWVCRVFLACGVLACQAAAPPDVLIVGAGIGGLTTALEAARNGARVLVVDQSSVFGGHAVASEGGLFLVATPVQKAQGIQDSPELAFRDFTTWGEDADEHWARLYAARSLPDVHDWMTAMGVKFTFVRFTPGNSVARFHENSQRGFGVVAPIYRECLMTGRVEFAWHIKVTALLRRDGRVVGVEGAHERTGRVLKWEAPAIVLATGGFQGNIELVKKHWPRGLAVPETILIGGGIHATGGGHALAKAAGAAEERMDHMWLYARGVPDPRYPASKRGLSVINRAGIMVNRNGARFHREVSGEKFAFPAMVQQPGARAWLVFDEAAKKHTVVAGTDWADWNRVEREIFGNPRLVHKAATLAGLARLSGISVDGLERGVARFNRSIDSGVDEDYGRFDHANPPARQPSGRPPILAVKQPPFYAIPLFPLTRKSMGGLATDRQSRVLDSSRTPIPGLYAVGEVAGFGGINGKAGLEGTFLGPSILQGRLLGKALAPASPREPTSPVSTETDSSVGKPGACSGCHPLEKQVALGRKGYWHFDRVHAKALETKWECSMCHAGMTPFRPQNHRIDRLAQVSSCVACHAGN
ncbi:MAG: FAD-dependent oxidoreductase [Bryobacterales bacterium]|nr:FAD-dependent oxidoreductase [Bryobacterales bacterium]